MDDLLSSSGARFQSILEGCLLHACTDGVHLQAPAPGPRSDSLAALFSPGIVEAGNPGHCP